MSNDFHVERRSAVNDTTGDGIRTKHTNHEVYSQNMASILQQRENILYLIEKVKTAKWMKEDKRQEWAEQYQKQLDALDKANAL